MSFYTVAYIFNIYLFNFAQKFSFTFCCSYLINFIYINNNRLSVTSDYDCILAMQLRLSRNDRLEVTPFSVPTTSGTVSVIWRDAKKCNTSGLTAQGSLNTCPMCEWRAEVDLSHVYDDIVVHESSKFRSRFERLSNLRLEACWRLFNSLAHPVLALPTAWSTAWASSNCVTFTPWYFIYIVLHVHLSVHIYPLKYCLQPVMY